MDSIFKDGRTGLFLPDNIRPLAKGYREAGASHTRRALKGFNARSSSPNEDINWNNSTLRQRGRMLYMSSPVATSAINTNRTKVVGVGLSLKSTIGREILGLTPEEAKEWQRRTEREFSLCLNFLTVYHSKYENRQNPLKFGRIAQNSQLFYKKEDLSHKSIE